MDRLGGRGVMTVSAALTAAGLGCVAAAHSLWVWYPAWMVVGVGMAFGLYDAAFATIGRLLGAKTRAAIVGVTLMGGFAGSIGWPVSAWLVTHHGWRIAVLFWALVQLLVILPVNWFGIPTAGPAVVAAPVTTTRGPPPARVFLLMASYFTLRASITAVISVHALTLLTGLGWSPTEAVAAAALIGPAQVAGRIVDWKFGRGYTPMIAAITGTVLLPLGFLSLLLGWNIVVFGVVYGISNGILAITRGTLPLYVFGPQGFGGRLGRIALPSMIAAAVAPTLVSPLIEIVPASQVAGDLAVAGVVSLGLILSLRR